MKFGFNLLLRCVYLGGFLLTKRADSLAELTNPAIAACGVVWEDEQVRKASYDM